MYNERIGFPLEFILVETGVGEIRKKDWIPVFAEMTVENVGMI